MTSDNQEVLDEFCKGAVTLVTDAINETFTRLVNIGMKPADLKLVVNEMSPNVWTVVNTSTGAHVGRGAVMVEWGCK